MKPCSRGFNGSVNISENCNFRLQCVLGFLVVITLRVTLSFTYAGALRVFTRLLRLRKKVEFRVINA